MTEFTILSWNIFWGLGRPLNKANQVLKGIQYIHTSTDKKTLPQIIQTINKYKPDVVALQEIDSGSKRNNNYNQVKVISEETNLIHNKYAFEKSWLGYFNDGNALFSKTPFNYVKIQQLPYNLEKRNCIIGSLNIKKKNITIIATHLGAHKSNKKERLNQVQSICNLLNSIESPMILMGDFNCQEGDEEYNYIVENSDLIPVISDKTYPSYKPSKKFDQIFISKDFLLIESNLIKENFSDHYGVYAKLQFR